MRQKASDYQQALSNRPHSHASLSADWNTIDSRVVLGRSMRGWNEVANFCDTVAVVRGDPTDNLRGPMPTNVDVHEFVFSDSETLDWQTFRAVVDLLRTRQNSQATFVVGPTQDFFAVACVCGWLMRLHGWDAAAAIWYVGSRYRNSQMWCYRDLLLELLDEYLETLR